MVISHSFWYGYQAGQSTVVNKNDTTSSFRGSLKNVVMLRGSSESISSLISQKCSSPWLLPC